jgi:nicotinate phosphoribosyltransferase
MPAMGERGLHTDLYQLTMAAGYFHRGLAHTRATCELFVRRLPAVRRYLVACGIDQALAAIENLAFDDDQIAFLRDTPALRDAMSADFVAYLRDFRFRGDVWAVDEGSLAFAHTPLLRITADIIEAQIVETLLLSIVNHGTMVASKAARIVTAAAGREVLEFGTRRTHPEAAIDAARAAYLVGAVGTSNVEAGLRHGIPIAGTAAHMWTMTHDDETTAFANYVATFPNASVLLIDTYDTLRGAERAARVAKDKLVGVRLDSGDLDALSREVRAVLDREGCESAKIVASGDLNELSIADLVGRGAPIDVFGVGTELVASKDAPSLGGVYKVVEYTRDGLTVPIAKLSEGKATYPGAHQVFRSYRDGRPLRDRLALVHEPAEPEEEALLRERIRAGRRVAPAGSLSSAREHAMTSIAALDPIVRELSPSEDPVYPVTLSSGVTALVAEVARERG